MRGFFFIEAVEKLLLSFITPFFLVPVLLAGAVILVSPVTASSFTGLSSFQTALANAVFAVSLITTAAGARFFSSTWESSWFQSCLLLPVPRSAGFWQTVLAHAILSTIVLILTSIAILAAFSPIAPAELLPTLAAGVSIILWASGIAAVAGILTTPSGASILATAVFAYSFLPLIDPADRIFSPALRITSIALPSSSEITPGWPSAASILFLLGQSVVLLLVAWFLYHLALRRGIRSGRE